MGVHQLLRYATDNFFTLKDQYDWLLFSTLRDDNATANDDINDAVARLAGEGGLDTLFTSLE